MNKTVYIAGSSAAAKFAGVFLHDAGVNIAAELSRPVDYILLDIPSFNPEGLLRDGSRIENALDKVSGSTVIIGGNLEHPSLHGYQKIDLLKDPYYLAQNAYITAECALDVALPYLDITLRHCPVLVLGWGRIGKCLGSTLKALGADVTIAARKDADLALLRALDYGSVNTSEINELDRYRLIFNTVPELILRKEQMAQCHPDCVKIDLASRVGMEDEDVIIARGLPGVHFPESSGRLIAETIVRKENLL